MCLSSPPPRKDKLVLLGFVGNAAPPLASEQRPVIALGGEEPEKQRGDYPGFPLVLFPLLLVILKAVVLKTPPGC